MAGKRQRIIEERLNRRFTSPSTALLISSISAAVKSRHGPTFNPAKQVFQRHHRCLIFVLFS